MTQSSVPPSTSVGAPVPSSSARAWLTTLAAALAAALITWAAGESLMILETGRLARRIGEHTISHVVAGTRNGMVCYAILGATLGLGMGLAGGLFRGSFRSGMLAGLVGLTLGGAAGAATAKVLVPFYFANYSPLSLSVPLLAHGGIWTSIAITAGLAFGLGAGGRGPMIEAMIYAGVGGLLATFIYEFAGVGLFPTVQTDRPLPVSPGSRIFAYLIVSLVIGAALAYGAVRGPRRAGGVSPLSS